MWEYLTEQLRVVLRYLKMNKQSVPAYISDEDVVNDVLLYLLEHPQEAKEIYEKKKFALLVVLTKAKIFEYTGKHRFDMDKRVYSYLLKMEKKCANLGIEITKENAYKIAAVMNDNQAFSIVKVLSLIEGMQKPERVPLSELEKEMIEDNYAV